jgi:hypothetical protein
MRLGLSAWFLALPLCAAAPPGCAGSTSLGTFQVEVAPFSEGAPLALKSVAAIPGGARLIWEPMHLTPAPSSKAEVTAVLVPAAADGYLLTLEPRKAAKRVEWQLPERPQVVALLYGPQGLSAGNIQSLVTRNPELLKALADYAQQSSQVESLVQQLADAEQNGDTDAVLKGFSSKYGVNPTKLNATPSNQQAALLLAAVLPTSNAYDPLAAQSAQVQQSGGLAGAVAGMFFGNPVALAAGGAALLENLRTAMFPGTDFRSAFAQSSDPNSLALCTKNTAAKSKMRTAYLWAYRVPQIQKPDVSLEGAVHLPLGSKSTLPLKAGKGSSLHDLGRARDWMLTPAAGGAPVPVEVQSTPAGSFDIDLAKTKASAGDYQLAATWDWDPLPVQGILHLHSYDEFKKVTLTRESHDRLVAGSGKIRIKLVGGDFEFLDKAAIQSTDPDAKPVDLSFTLPSGKRAGPQNSLSLRLDTATPGPFLLVLAQTDAVKHEIPVTVLPPNPGIADLPIRLNEGELHEAIHLQGTGLERIEGASSDAGPITGAPDSAGWSGNVALKAGLRKGQRFALLLKVQGLEDPLTLADAIEIVGPRPKIQSMHKSGPGAFGITVAADELPAGTPVGLVLMVEHLEHHSRPHLELGCASGDLRHTVTLFPGEPLHGASLAFAGPGALYLSLDPGFVGYAGCQLAATVILDPEGRSDPFPLGRVIRIPLLDKFTLTDEKVGDSSYAAVLEGRDLDVIERAGWDAQNGLPIDSIPAPIPGDSTMRQTLRLVLPWPAPAPHSPLYVWLRGETVGRKTAVSY